MLCTEVFSTNVNWFWVYDDASGVDFCWENNGNWTSSCWWLNMIWAFSFWEESDFLTLDTLETQHSGLYYEWPCCLSLDIYWCFVVYKQIPKRIELFVMKMTVAVCKWSDVSTWWICPWGMWISLWYFKKKLYCSFQMFFFYLTKILM